MDRNRAELTGRCLAAFVQAGTLAVSLDRLAETTGVSKRMLIHYYGSREALEEQSITLLEDRLRTQFSPAHFPAGVTLPTVVLALWDRSTGPESLPTLLLILDVWRKAWSGSERGRAFYDRQQRLWVDLLRTYCHDKARVEELLQLLIGTVVSFAVTRDPAAGRRALLRFLQRQIPADASGV